MLYYNYSGYDVNILNLAVEMVKHNNLDFTPEEVIKMYNKLEKGLSKPQKTSSSGPWTTYTSSTGSVKTTESGNTIVTNEN